ncbi:hypothetical protein AXF42_Ash011834 [Apostasia shenzhenica]|uniref:Uncharacterized protein n=1 Tax=Apostasia shenzhenica TaxID=1088818 RepID=A0A2I0AVY8_9ASPA|nr:hypothetical protein AXF42_Ash011834 [Apostasia shenzhenica]
MITYKINLPELGPTWDLSLILCNWIITVTKWKEIKKEKKKTREEDQKRRRGRIRS